ncbi:hypothetical protein GWI33_011236 [Rhynchophorus ferrugineus]|uniref:Uncharacterized protein n=1 Tax=Rhynchophorus ferrugineus TaxID=354439 RepID=A0A834I9Z5_RHYFE|nr:hypothetical protein GWI33_011236 [Rhynchophorus ferrugineus]
MWFGPRIGRRKRNQEIKHNNNRNDKDDDNLLDILKESPLVVVAVRDAGKDFTPRLGRESGENNPNWFEDGELMESASISNRASNHFNPRLGRESFAQFNPRLGRELD